MNLYNLYENLEGAKGKYSWWIDGQGYTKASECVECGQCEEVCPQHIHIREELKKAVEILEK